MKFWKDKWFGATPLRGFFSESLFNNFLIDVWVVDFWDDGSWGSRYFRQLND